MADLSRGSTSATVGSPEYYIMCEARSPLKVVGFQDFVLLFALDFKFVLLFALSLA